MKSLINNRSNSTEVTHQKLTTRRIGFIAQDVAKILPELVHPLSCNQTDSTDADSESDSDGSKHLHTITRTDENAPLLGIKYQDIIPHLVVATQDMDQWLEKELSNTSGAGAGDGTGTGTGVTNTKKDKAALLAAIDELETILARVEKKSNTLHQAASI